MTGPRPSSKVRRVIISPHLDDAVLSCWNVLAMGDCTVVTVFAGVPMRSSPSAWDEAGGAASAGDHVRARRAEDARALELVGAIVLHLDFLDEPYRTAPLSHAELTAALEELVDGRCEVWLPAGIGGHVDHVSIALAAEEATRGCPRFVYADMPYAWESFAGESPAEPSEADRLGDTNGEDLVRAAALLDAALPLPCVPRVHRLTAAQVQTKRRSLARYASQSVALGAAFPRWASDPAALQWELSWPMPPSTSPRAPLTALPRPPAGPPDDTSPAPFLSVLMRTTGRRPKPLAQAMTSLAAQSDPDFELLLLAHNITPRDLQALGAQRDELPAGLRERTSICVIEGGSRARPLNAGLRRARGRYVAVLDDDDLALPDWVAEFRRLARRRPDHTLRTTVLRVDTAGNHPDVAFPPGFDLLDHLTRNRSPLCGFAFPRTWIAALDLAFDTELPVFEDWDFLLRITPLTGVVSSAAVTSHYRHWHLNDDSHAQYGPDDFEIARRRIVAKADAEPLVLPAGAVTRMIRDRLDHEQDQQQLAQMQTALAEADARTATIAERLAAAEAELQVAQTRFEAEKEEASRALASAHAERVIERHAHDSVVAANARELAVVHERLRGLAEEFRSSRSWRVTTPLRRAADRFRRRAGADDQVAPAAPGPREEPLATSVAGDHFDRLYADDEDPWKVVGSWYEQRKFALTLAALPRDRYRSAFEPGCSIGVLTAELARRCDDLLAADVSPAAVRLARERVGPCGNVRVERMTLPSEWPPGPFDLIVVSELARYLALADLSDLVDRAIATLRPGGHLMAVHHRAPGDVPLTAEQVHAVIDSRPALDNLGSYHEVHFLLDVWERLPASASATAGI